MKKIVLVFIFFTVTPLALFSSTLSLIALSSSTAPKGVKVEESLIQYPQPGVQVYASLPSKQPSVLGQTIEADARSEIVRQYLEANSSPLTPFSEVLVQVADKYSLDYRLLTAIAQKESGLCRVIPEKSYNCWGWGIHSQGTLRFDSYPEAIETVSKGLKERYIDEGYVTVEEIMKKYAHPSSTTWAEGVSYYMSQME